MNSDEKFKRAKVSKEKGLSFFQAHNYKVALKLFKRAVNCLEREPSMLDDSQDERTSLLISCYLNISLCLMRLNNFADVPKVCDKVLKLDPKNEKALFRRGQARVDHNDYLEAIQDFRNLLKFNPANKAAQNYITLCERKYKEQKMRDKTTYNEMFENFKESNETAYRKDNSMATKTKDSQSSHYSTSAEIEERNTKWNETSKTPFNSPQLAFQLSDKDVMEDLTKLLDRSCSMQCDSPQEDTSASDPQIINLEHIGEIEAEDRVRSLFYPNFAEQNKAFLLSLGINYDEPQSPIPLAEIIRKRELSGEKSSEDLEAESEKEYMLRLGFRFIEPQNPIPSDEIMQESEQFAEVHFEDPKTESQKHFNL